MPGELTTGTQVDRYQLLFRLGKGGMGEVWAASSGDSSLAFQKLIALKVLRTTELASNSAKLFFDEARTASALTHAAIVPTVDFGRDGDVLYIAMDLVRGPSLSAILQRLVINKTTMSPAVVALIGAQIAAALDYAHERATFDGKQIRLIHRDISPHNILCDLSGNPRLMDFGVARTAIQTHESRVGTVRGKPSYMAPEQVAGGDLDARSDIFALGIVLWESACLKRLFGRSNPVKSMEAVMKHEPKPLTEMVPGFPPALSGAIAKALDKDPSARFQRPGDFMDALTAALRTIPGSSGAERALSQLIETSFPPDAFDIDRRVQEALALASGSAPEPTRLAEAPTVAKRLGRGDAGQEEASAPMLVPTVAWPTAPSPDPLAPEAIEEARTAFAVRTATGVQRLNTAVMGSIDAYTSLSGQSMPVLRSHTNRWLAPTLAVAATLIGAAAFVASRNAPPPEPAAMTATTEPQTREVRVMAKPSASSDTVEVEAEPSPEETPEPRTEEASSEARTPKRAPSTRRTTPNPGEAATAAAAVPPKKAAPETHEVVLKDVEATPAEVRDLIRQVKAVDPQAASQMYPMLAEAGNHNVDALNELRRKARAILNKAR